MSRARATIFLGGCLTLLAARPAAGAPFAYVSNYGSNSVWIIDGADQSVAAVVAVGSGPLGVAVAVDGRRVYVANQGDDSLSVIDAGARRVVATVELPLLPPRAAAAVAGSATFGGPTVTRGPTVTPTPKRVGAEPVGIAVDPTGTRVYVASVGGLTVLDAQSLAVLETRPIVLTDDVNSRLQGVAVGAGGQRVYAVADNGYQMPGALLQLDATGERVLAAVAVGLRPLGVAVSPDGSRAYVANSLSDSVSVVDTIASRVVATIAVAGQPQAVAIGVDGRQVFVSTYGPGAGAGSDLVVIDAASDAVVDRVALSGAGFGVSVDPASGRVYAAVAGSDQLAIVDPAAALVLAEAPTGAGPAALGQFVGPAPDPHATPTATPTAAPARELAYVANHNGRSVSVLDTAAARAIARFPVAAAPIALAASPKGDLVYVGTYDDQEQRVEVVSTVSYEPLASLPFAHGVWSLDVSPDGRALYVGGYGAVSAVETTGHTVVAEIPVNLGEGGAALTPDGATLLVSRSSMLSFLDTASRQVVQTIAIGNSTLGAIAVAPDGARAYVDGGPYGIGVTVVDLAQRRVIGGVPFAYTPGEGFFRTLAVSADGLSLLGVTTFRPYGPVPQVFYGLSVVDTDRDAIVTTLTPEVEPAAIAFSAERGLGYVANAGANTVSVFDPTAQRLVDTIPVGSRPAAIAIAPAPGATRLATVTVRPTRTPTATPTLTPDRCPRAIVLHPDHGAPAARIDLAGSCDQLAGRRYAQVGLVPPVSGGVFPQPRGDDNGAYRGSFIVPRGARPGSYVVQVITGNVIGEAPFTIDAPCTGDCDGHGGVRIDELIIGVNLVLGAQPLEHCPAFDAGLDGVVTVDELVAGVRHAVEGCGVAP
ncbi:MAG TPA: hypothetical protein VL049_15455 [Candidatus Dormibacteraeota bacterium]|nr:hypothetical protein [Candidatus Dormibacteraeota bacterium]